jgi:predicted nucleotidyltransferase
MEVKDNIDIKETVEALKTNFRIKDIILFGSYANNTSDKNSDIDIIVVLDDNTFSDSYDSRLEKRLAVSKTLNSIKSKVQVDSLVFTKPEWEKFISLNSSFSREIQSTGISLI